MIKLAQEYFLQSTKLYPLKRAVNFQTENITYEELNLFTNQLSNFLLKNNVKRNDRIAFYVEKSINSIKSILGILKADCCYVPLDPKSPPVRLRQIIEDCLPSIIIADNSTIKNIPLLLQDLNISDYHPPIIILNKKEIKETNETDYHFQEEIEQESSLLPIPKNGSKDLAYIFYTSGSTGKPKGVMITHGNIISFTNWAVSRFNITENDKLSNHAPMHFDLSTFDIYCTFKSGATLFIVPYELNLFPEKIVQFIEKNELTIWLSVPSILVYMARMNVLSPQRMPTLKMIFSTGEVFPTPFLVQWMQLYPHKKFINMFGPTETTVECTYYIIDEIPQDLSKNIPMGKACDHLEVFALNDTNQKTTVGEVGELYVRGPAVSPGYWNNPEKTAQTFVLNPLFPHLNDYVYKTGDLVELKEDGNYLFRGRKDNQIKFMGYRIELGEIEAAIYSLKYIKEAGVIFIPADEKSEIVAYLSIKEEKTIEQIKKDIGTIVPKYMVPRTIIIEKELPRTSTGKVDKVTLKSKFLEHK